MGDPSLVWAPPGGGAELPTARALAWALTDRRLVVFGLRDVAGRPGRVLVEMALREIRWAWARPDRRCCWVALLLDDASLHEYRAGRRAGAVEFVEALTGLLAAAQPSPGTWHGPPGPGRPTT